MITSLTHSILHIPTCIALAMHSTNTICISEDTYMHGYTSWARPAQVGLVEASSSLV